MGKMNVRKAIRLTVWVSALAMMSACGPASAEMTAEEQIAEAAMSGTLGLPFDDLPTSAEAWAAHVAERNTRCTNDAKARVTGPRNCVKASRDFLASAGVARDEQQDFIPGATGAKQIGEFVRRNAHKLPAGWRIKTLSAGEAIDTRLGGLVFYGCRVAGRPLGHVTTLAGGLIYDNYTRGKDGKSCPGSKRKGVAYQPGEEYCAKVAFLQLYNEAWVTP